MNHAISSDRLWRAASIPSRMSGVSYPQQPYDPNSYGAVTPYSADPYSPPPVLRQPKSVGAAVALELVPGLFGVFGVGNMYAGRVGLGIALMLSFWVLFWINVALFYLLIGWVTLPLTWIVYLIGGALLAANGASRHNAGY
jgi:TM2 domain-containing membrane protein YozV